MIADGEYVNTLAERCEGDKTTTTATCKDFLQVGKEKKSVIKNCLITQHKKDVG